MRISRRSIARHFRGRVQLPLRANRRTRKVKDQRDQAFAFVIAGHQAKAVQRDWRTVIRDRNLSGLEIENCPVSLVVNHKIDCDLPSVH